MIADEKLLKLVSKRMAALEASAYEGIKLFIQTFSAIVAGTVWLKGNLHHVLPSYIVASDFLVGALTMLCVAMIWDNQGSWVAWRRRLDLITKDSALPMPTISAFLAQNGRELVNSTLLMLVSVGFVFFNPLALPG